MPRSEKEKDEDKFEEKIKDLLKELGKLTLLTVIGFFITSNFVV
jgi:hypothetical protein